MNVYRKVCIGLNATSPLGDVTVESQSQCIAFSSCEACTRYPFSWSFRGFVDLLGAVVVRIAKIGGTQAGNY